MKKPRSPVASDRRFKGARDAADHGPEARWQHAGRVFEPTDRAGILAARAVDADILDRLVLAGRIAAHHRDAAVRFRGDFQAAGMAAHLCGSYSPVRGSFSFFSGWDERSDAEEEAYGRWRQAVQAMGAMASGTVISIVCYDEPFSDRLETLFLVGVVKLAKWYGMRAGSDQHIDKAAPGQVAAGRLGGRSRDKLI